jgi:hypothetical protein
MRKRLIGITILVLLLLAPAMNIAYAEDGTNSTSPTLPPTPPDPTGDSNSTLGNSTLPDDGNQTDPTVIEELLEQAEESRLVLMAAFTNAYGENYSQAMKKVYDPSENGTSSDLASMAALNNQVHGDDAVEKASKLLEQANSTAAAQQVKRAMKHYTNALRKIYHDVPEAMEGFGEEESPDPDLPDDNGTSVNQTDIMSTKLMLIQRFQENFQQRIMSMEENVNSLMNQLSEKDAQKAEDALENAERKLLRIQERINRSEFDEALDDLQNATDVIEGALDDFEDNYTAQMLRTMYKLEAKVQRMVDKMNRKAAKGGNTSGEEDAINQAWGQLKKLQEDAQKGKSSSAPGQTNNGGNGKGKGNGNSNGKNKEK